MLIVGIASICEYLSKPRNLDPRDKASPVPLLSYFYPLPLNNASGL